HAGLRPHRQDQRRDRQDDRNEEGQQRAHERGGGRALGPRRLHEGRRSPALTPARRCRTDPPGGLPVGGVGRVPGGRRHPAAVRTGQALLQPLAHGGGAGEPVLGSFGERVDDQLGGGVGDRGAVLAGGGGRRGGGLEGEPHA